MKCTTEGCNNNVLRCDTVCHQCASAALTNEISQTRGISAMEKLVSDYMERMHKAIGEG